MQQSPDLLLFSVVIGLALFALAITLLPMMLFFKVMARITALEKCGETEAAYRLAQKLFHVTHLPFARKAVGKGMIPLLLLQMARLAEASGELEAAMDWAKQASSDEFDSGYRSIAWQYQATLLRKQDRNVEAEAIEAHVLSLPPESQSDRNAAKPEWELGDTARITILYSQGRFREAFERIEAASLHATPIQFLTLAEKKVILFRAQGQHEEALATQQEMETRFETIRGQWSNSRATNTAVNVMLRTHYLKAALASRMMRISLCLESGKVGAAGEVWDALPAEVVDDDTEALRYATGAWLFAARGDGDTARRLITDLPTGSNGANKTAIHALLGRAQFALHDYSAAAEQFQRELASCAGKPLAEAENRVLLAACYAKQEKYDLARVEWEAVVAAGFEEAFFTQPES